MKKLPVLFLLMAYFIVGWSADPTIVIKNNKQTKAYTRSELLKRDDIETIVVAKDPAYQYSPQSYEAIKASQFFKDICVDDDAAIEFQTTDGFAAPISKARLLNTNPDESIAYIAIERPNTPWPKRINNGPSAGPFYLIWKNPHLSDIKQEEWPFMLAGFEIKASLNELYPKIFPDKNLAENSPVKRGFKVFQQNCFACHTMNGQGASNLGPDLNIPMNPTEYFVDAAFKKLIRNPSSVRTWPNQVMYGFSEDVLSDDEINDLLDYLKYMAATR